LFRFFVLAVVLIAGGCGDGGDDGAGAEGGSGADTTDPLADAMAGVFIQPYEDCREPLDGEPGQGPGGQVCTQVAISASTEAGRYFPDYASCDVVRTQRPFYPVAPAGEPDPEDPRLQDDEFMTELAWAKEQIEASACTCCHDSRQNDGQVGQWDIAAGGIWITTLSDSGVALFAGLADSSVFGSYPAEDNNGFDRTDTGIPTDDTGRMQAFLREVMEYRGITEEQARAVPPFGGPIYEARVAEVEPCGPGQGIEPDGTMRWTGGPARYLYVTEADAENPGVPPNLDLPDGTLLRYDVPASERAVDSGIVLDDPPDVLLQRMPEQGAPELEQGQTYKLVALLDVGVPITSCLFEFGEPVAEMQASEPVADGEGDAPGCEGPDVGFGDSCATDADCGCAQASYCALMPGQTTGTCTATGCLEDPGVCPDGYGCFDVSIFAPGQPSICI
jgi:hypothetical protein